MTPRLILRWRHRLHSGRPQFGIAKIVRHPVAGSLSMVYASLAPAGELADVRMIVYAPADATSAERIHMLVG